MVVVAAVVVGAVSILRLCIINAMRLQRTRHSLRATETSLLGHALQSLLLSGQSTLTSLHEQRYYSTNRQARQN